MPIPAWEVVSVQPHPDYTLALLFADGGKRVYNARPLLGKPIYAPLLNLSFFMGARAECGTVVWSDDVDIAPEHLYENSIPAAGV